MNIYAISDLHLSAAKPKPMDIFGYNWKNHWEKIKHDWVRRVSDGDAVLIPGDISWAIRLQGAVPDLQDISELPGRKILTEGNHDYWWQSASKVRSVLPEGMQIIQNDHTDCGDFSICGTRGWILPGDGRIGEGDMKIFRRELIRLELSLKSAACSSDKGIIAMLHFPPFNEKGEPSEFVDVLRRYNVKKCVYGHLHGESLKNVFEGLYGGIEFYMVSCDFLDFKLKKIY